MSFRLKSDDKSQNLRQLMSILKKTSYFEILVNCFSKLLGTMVLCYETLELGIERKAEDV